MASTFFVSSSVAAPIYYVAVKHGALPTPTLRQMGFRWDPEWHATQLRNCYSYEGRWVWSTNSSIAATDQQAAHEVLVMWDRLVALGLEARGSLAGLRLRAFLAAQEG